MSSLGVHQLEWRALQPWISSSTCSAGPAAGRTVQFRVISSVMPRHQMRGLFRLFSGEANRTQRSGAPPRRHTRFGAKISSANCRQLVAHRRSLEGHRDRGPYDEAEEEMREVERELRNEAPESSVRSCTSPSLAFLGVAFFAIIGAAAWFGLPALRTRRLSRDPH